MEQSTKSLKIINEAFPQLPIIGVGGVMSKNDFDTKIMSGASLVQIYTGFIIHGPQIVKQILNKYKWNLLVVITIITFLIGTISFALPSKSSRNISALKNGSIQDGI